MGILQTRDLPYNIGKQESYIYERDAVSYSALADDTQTVTRDFICTGIYFWSSCGENIDPSNARMDVTINGQIISGCRVEAQAGESAAESTFCVLPEWIIKQGQTIVFNETQSFGAAGASVVGYLLP